MVFYFSKMVRAFIGIGSNTGDRKKNITRAFKVLENNFEVKNRSGVYEAEPIGYIYDDWFYNAIVEIETDKDPELLLKTLHSIEDQFGRIRSMNKITLDLDLLFYGNQIVERFDLQVPHIKIPNRKFVLKPMAEIAPDYVHPITNKTIKDMLKEVNVDKEVKKLRGNFE